MGNANALHSFFSGLLWVNIVADRGWRGSETGAWLVLRCGLDAAFCIYLDKGLTERYGVCNLRWKGFVSLIVAHVGNVNEGKRGVAWTVWIVSDMDPESLGRWLLFAVWPPLSVMRLVCCFTSFLLFYSVHNRHWRSFSRTKSTRMMPLFRWVEYA